MLLLCFGLFVDTSSYIVLDWLYFRAISFTSTDCSLVRCRRDMLGTNQLFSLSNYWAMM